jgi:hypothetical protein
MQRTLGLIISFMVFGVAIAHADPKAEETCLASHKKTQELELDKKLVEAESQAVACSQSSCPVEVREMCVDFLRRIRENESSAVITVRDASGSSISNAHITIDGRPGPTTLDGSAVHLNPGTHLIEYQVGEGPKRSQTVLLREGEKDRQILLLSEDASKRPRFSPWAHLFGGLGAASLAGFAVVGGVVLARAHSLDKECGHRCESERPSDVDSVLHQAIAADVSLGAGLTLVAAAGLTMGITWSKAPSSKAAASSRANFAISPRGMGLDIRF